MSLQNNNNDRNDLFRIGSFNRYLSASVISILGDQFTLIAMPWLVLRLTGDTFILGLVLAMMSVPRAVFILVGGAIVDRHSPIKVLLATKYINTIVLVTFSILIFTNSIQIWMIYIFALLLGLSTAFSIPSATSILPLIIAGRYLTLANSIIMGQRQICLLAGPLIAGLLIVLFGDGSPSELRGAYGLGFAFLLDGISYLISALVLSRVDIGLQQATVSLKQKYVLQSVWEGLRHFSSDAQLRTLCVYYAAVGFFITGPMQVAIPILADTRFNHRADIFGLLVAAHGAGTFLGMLLSGIKSNLRYKNLGITILLMDGIAAFLFLPIIYMNIAWQAVCLLLVVGVLSGFLQIAVFTWMQRRVAPSFIGRAMSLFMFVFVGVAPISASITGLILRYVSLNTVFIGSSAFLILIVLIGLSNRYMRGITDIPVLPSHSS